MLKSVVINSFSFFFSFKQKEINGVENHLYKSIKFFVYIKFFTMMYFKGKCNFQSNFQIGVYFF